MEALKKRACPGVGCSLTPQTSHHNQFPIDHHPPTMRFFSTLIVILATFACSVWADEALIRKDIQDIDAQATALKDSLLKTDGTVSGMRMWMLDGDQCY